MAQWLNKLITGLLVFASWVCYAQTPSGTAIQDKDYKDPKQHEKFYKRRNQIGAWQINQLKNGALVVRLKTNQMLIDELNKAGRTKEAEEKTLEAYAINKNTMFAFLDKFNFCKVYFMNSNYSDTLLGGATSGIFLDTNLRVDPSIKMNESFYLLAERDYGYNSSIGFLPEDSARGVMESGNPVKQMAFVIKNKYGHQLKNPFPYSVPEKNFMNAAEDVPVRLGGPGVKPGEIGITYQIDKRTSEEKEKDKSKRMGAAHGTTMVKLPKQFSYEKLSQAVDQLNDELRRFYQASPSPEKSKMPEDVRPFLY